MLKNFPYNGMLVLAVLLFSAVLIVLATYAETCVQGPLNVPSDISFIAYIPGRYALYRESVVDTKAIKAKRDAANAITDAANADNGLNETLVCWLRGDGHLSALSPKAWYAAGIPYCHKDSKSGKYRVGMPFAEFEILWPGSYHLHVEFSGVVDKHPNVTVGPKGLIILAVIISIIAQLVVLSVLISKSNVFRPKSNLEQVQK
jgi:hypothetical protein